MNSSIKRMGKSEKYSKKNRLWRKCEFCWICFQVIESYPEATIDHVLPISQGGNNSIGNLQLTHEKCNLIKGNKYMKLKLVELTSHILEKDSKLRFKKVQIFPMSIDGIEPDPELDIGSIIHLKTGKEYKVKENEKEIREAISTIGKSFSGELH